MVSLAASAFLVTMLGAAEPASAASATFVSGNGNNASDCLTPATACRQIDTAISKTDSGGTVAVLPGDYQPFTVGEAGKQVDVIGLDGIATITGLLLPDPSGGTGSAAVVVNVDAAGNLPIKIHGLTIAARGGGILILGNSPEVDIRNCAITSFSSSYAIDFRPGESGKLFVSDTLIARAVNSGTGGGVRIKPTGGASSTAVIDHTLLQNYVSGILIDGRATTGNNNVTVQNSVVAAGNSFGISFVDEGGGTTKGVVDSTTITGNTAQGLGAYGTNVTVRVKDSRITGNGQGLERSGAQLISNGGNVVAENTSNGTFSSTVAPQ